MGETTPGQSVTIVNRLYPPVAGVTGEAAHELASYLTVRQGMHVHVVHVNGKYFGKTDKLSPVGEVHMIRPVYNGKIKVLRLLGNLIEGYRLIRKARRLNACHTIVMTDPPLLAMWASMLLGRNRSWSLWTMDVYPQAFIANQLVTERNFLYRKLKELTFRNPPAQIVALGPGQQRYVAKSYHRDLDGIILPCGIYEENGSTSVPDWKKDDDRIYLGYCGNLGEAHSARFVEALMHRLDPDKHRLILSTYGRNAKRTNQIARDLPTVEIVDFVPRNDLKHIDIHLVTLLSEWTHVCVPSKAVSAICAERTMLFCGTEQCDTWGMLGEAGWRVDHGDQMEADLDAFIASVTPEMVSDKKERAKNLATRLIEMRDDAFKAIAESIANDRKGHHLQTLETTTNNKA